MGILSRKQRNALPDSAFALPEKREYPIDTPERARNALARKHFASKSDQARICAAVLHAYPEIHSESCPGVHSMERTK